MVSPGNAADTMISSFFATARYFPKEFRAVLLANVSAQISPVYVHRACFKNVRLVFPVLLGSINYDLRLIEGEVSGVLAARS